MTIAKKHVEEIEAIREEDIDYSDIPETNEDFWINTKVRMPQSTHPSSLSEKEGTKSGR